MKNSIGLYYQLTVSDKKTGKIIRKTKLKRSKSFVLQFLQILEIQMFPSVNVTITDISGNSYSSADNVGNFSCEGAVGNTNQGTVVGTGTTTETNTDTAMETLIAHGVGAGQLSYGATSKTTTAEVGANVDFIITRTFTNSSGGSINVTEAGLHCLYNGTRYGLAIRDVFSAVAVGNGQVLTVTYTLRTTA